MINKSKCFILYFLSLLHFLFLPLLVLVFPFIFADLLCKFHLWAAEERLGRPWKAVKGRGRPWPWKASGVAFTFTVGITLKRSTLSSSLCHWAATGTSSILIIFYEAFSSAHWSLESLSLHTSLLFLSVQCLLLSFDSSLYSSYALSFFPPSFLPLSSLLCPLFRFIFLSSSLVCRGILVLLDLIRIFFRKSCFEAVFFVACT